MKHCRPTFKTRPKPVYSNSKYLFLLDSSPQPPLPFILPCCGEMSVSPLYSWNLATLCNLTGHTRTYALTPASPIQRLRRFTPQCGEQGPRGGWLPTDTGTTHLPFVSYWVSMFVLQRCSMCLCCWGFFFFSLPVSHCIVLHVFRCMWQ